MISRVDEESDGCNGAEGKAENIERCSTQTP